MRKRKKIATKENYYHKTVKLLKEKLFHFLLGFFIVMLSVALILKNLKFTPPVKKAKKTANKKLTALKSPPQLFYTVQAGETLWSIAEKFYGNGFMMEEIAKANKLDPNQPIEVGQKILIPKPTSTPVIKGETSSLETNNHSFYIVKEGDYLYKIAQQVYGNGDLWVKIAQANKISDPNILITGTKLIIPR